MLSVLLSSFYEVARQCSVTAAAKRLGISQPTLTGRIRQLEEQYGIELFYRRGSRLELTDVGARLMPLAQGMLREAAEADFLLRSAGGLSGLGGGRLRLGATGPYYILPAMAAFRQAYPRIALSLDIGNSREVIEALCDCRVDLAVSSHALDDERLCRRTIARSPLVLVLRADHPLAGRTVVELADLAGLPLLLREEGSMTRQLTEQALAAAGSARSRPWCSAAARRSTRRSGSASAAACCRPARCRAIPSSPSGRSPPAHRPCPSTSTPCASAPARR
ncbi:LysR substrate-binding domain-containing protein [Chitinimonas koreensis]|uniref:LysR substrate-binding domain-containing protein n=1 Tax=Chitinimonas koreensis TaxID=356302 RepID=UPI00223FF2E2|nr:LysR substrate-binding domain-containing protein [Chitinimonas koreensis]